MKIGGKYYFHNLKFDMEFIIHWLLINKYEWIKLEKDKNGKIINKEDKKDKTFTTLITDMGVFFQASVYYKKGKQLKSVTFIDSLKMLNMSIENIAKTFNLPISKLELDYSKYRKVGHKLTKDEKEYIINDIKIPALAIKELFKMGLTKNTQARKCFNFIQKNFGWRRKKFQTLFS